MAEFHFRHHNRLEYPTKYVLVAEDDLQHQVELATHLSHMFDRQGKVQCSFVCGSMAAAAIMQTHQVDLLILDFDMPLGNAADLIAWMVENDRQIPIVTASGWEPNLAVMDSILVKTNIPYRIFSKQQVIVGEADEYIRSFLT